MGLAILLSLFKQRVTYKFVRWQGDDESVNDTKGLPCAFPLHIVDDGLLTNYACLKFEKRLDFSAIHAT